MRRRISIFFPIIASFARVKDTAAMSSLRVIDSHLHVWASHDESQAFPYVEGQEPPESLVNSASTSTLLKQMDASGVVGALIVQPINHKFDHSYVLNSIKEYPHRFKGMLLYDPSLPEEDAISRLEDLSLKGFVGVRFNPYLWPKIGDKSWETMSKGAGLATYKRCAELMMPVGVMCFQGLELHYEDILKLIKESPATTLILDHFGFTGLSENGDVAFQKLLALAEHPQVYVKISALFRLEDSVPYDRVREERLDPLLKAFGADRLMFGTDFPFVMEHDGQYHGTVERVKSWLTDETACKAVMGGTAEKLFGEWPRS